MDYTVHISRSKSTIKALEEGVKCFHNKDIGTTSMVVLVYLFLTLYIFHTFFSASIADFKQVNAGWVILDI